MNRAVSTPYEAGQAARDGSLPWRAGVSQPNNPSTQKHQGAQKGLPLNSGLGATQMGAPNQSGA